MEQHTFLQGSNEWHAHRATHLNASDAPAMMGVSPYKTRTQLLHEMATGITPEIDAATQRRFDEGHRIEALARPLAEAIIGQDLYPVVGSNGKLSASFDGLTMDETICFEHKTLNNALRSMRELPDQYRIQMEQQLYVSGAEKCLFMATRWEGDELAEPAIRLWYESSDELRRHILDGWAQFEKDLAAYVPPEVMPVAVAAPTKDLLALSIQVNGTISLISNLDKFGAQLNEFVAGIDKEPNDDQGFADAEAAIKTLKQAQEALEAAESSALAQTADIDDMRRTVKLYADIARTTRLMLEKMVKARKESIKVEIAQVGRDALAAHIENLNKRLGKPYIPPIAADFGGVMKGKKTLTSLRGAVDDELARVKIESRAIADRIEINLNSLRELAKDYSFLFSDTRDLVMKENDGLIAIIKTRVAEHCQAEAEKLEIERRRIRQEEETRANAEAQAKAKREAEAKAQEELRLNMETEQARILEESRKPETAAPAPANDPMPNPVDLRSVVVENNDDSPTTVKLGEICGWLGFSVTAEFLGKLGFYPVGTDRAAKLYRESDFVRICDALVAHIKNAALGTGVAGQLKAAA